MADYTLLEFMGSLPSILTGVTNDGDIVRVTTETQGAFVVLEESEYKILRDALETLLTAK